MKPVTEIKQLDANRLYSYADYLVWRLSERVELIKGKVFKMAPAPSEEHQQLSVRILSGLLDQLKGKPCKLYHAPFDVRLPTARSQPDKEVFTVVQPDLVIVCDLSKIDRRGCMGPPDVVFEIVSRYSLQKDLHEKYELYESSGVREYWIVDPGAQTVQVNTLGQHGAYIPGRLLTRGDVARSRALEGLGLTLDDVFPMVAEEPEELYVRM